MTIAGESEASTDSLERKVPKTEGPERARALMQLASVYYSNKQYLESIATWEEAFHTFDADAEGKAVDAAECYRQKAVVLADIGRTGEAMDLIEKAQETFRQQVASTGVARCELLMGDILLQNLRRPDEAIRILESAREFFSAHEMDAEFGYCCLRIGQALEDLEAFDRALDELKIAEEFLVKSGLYQYQADSLDCAASLLFRLGRYEESIFWFKKARRAYESSGYTGNAMMCDHRIAEAKLLFKN